MQETIDQFEMLSVMLAPDFDKSEWEFSWGNCINWVPLSCFESWKEHIKNSNTTKFRKIKKTQVINGFVVPAPIKNWEDLKGYEYYFAPWLFEPWLCERCRIREEPNDFDNRRLDRGLIFKTKEDAVAVAKAMLGIDPYK